MVEGNIMLNRNGLLDFLDFVGEKGLMKKATAGSYKKACSVVLKILDETEAADLSKIDLENVITRHRNIAAGRISPTTLKNYEIRVRAAIKSYFDYTRDPSSWKPTTQQRASRRAGASAKKTKDADVATEPKVFEKPEVPNQPSVHIDLQIHISPDASPTQIDKIFESISRHLSLR